jgi:flagellar capping protein FliD
LFGLTGKGNVAGTGLVGAFNTAVNSATSLASGFLTKHIEGLERQNAMLDIDISYQQRHLDQYKKQQLTKFAYMENSVLKSNFNQQLIERMFSKI